MAFKGTLVAFEEEAAAYPYLGFPFKEIVLHQPNGEDASNPDSISIESRDRVTEGITGSDVAVVRRKLTELILPIDYVDSDTKAEIERLVHDGRPVYFCPNVGPDTLWSFPFQRGLKDFAGKRTLACTRTGDHFVWDATDRVFRVFDDDEPAISFHGHWSRFLRVQSGIDNHLAFPHPNSTLTGWSVSSGTATITYTESIKAPVLSRRAVTNGKGVAFVDVPASGSTVIKNTSAATLSTTLPVVGTVCLAWKGDIYVSLTNPAGTTIYEITGPLTGDGKFQLIKLAGANSDATNQAEIRITFADSALEKQTAFIGPALVGNSVATIAVDDWHDGTSNPDVISESDTVETLVTDMTVSMFWKLSDYRSAMVQIGSTNFVKITAGSTADSIQVWTMGATSPVTFTLITTTFGVAIGDWVHLAFVFDDAGIKLYVNGVAHVLNDTEKWEPITMDKSIDVGLITNLFLTDSGISHLRCDGVAWTAQEVLDHYHTYFADQGRGIVEPMFGKICRIEEMIWEPRLGSSEIQWVGSLIVKELGPDADLAPLIRQEGTL